MADVEPYGVMPYSEIKELKKQIASLQGKDNVDAGSLLKSVTGLTKSMDSMLQLFKSAAEEMKLEEQEEKALSQQIRPLMDKLDEIIEQNKIIAEGMVAVSDLVKERLPGSEPHEDWKFPEMSKKSETKPLEQSDIESGHIPQKPVSTQPQQPPIPIFPPPQKPGMEPPPTGPPPDASIMPAEELSPMPPDSPFDSEMNIPPVPQDKKKGLFGGKQ